MEVDTVIIFGGQVLNSKGQIYQKTIVIKDFVIKSCIAIEKDVLFEGVLPGFASIINVCHYFCEKY